LTPTFARYVERRATSKTATPSSEMTAATATIPDVEFPVTGKATTVVVEPPPPPGPSPAGGVEEEVVADCDGGDWDGGGPDGAG
jgi:hypothetical protein